uniref:3FTx-Tri1 n=1 Tax=Trimorphodon biscutatus TaxID=338818 RepID=A7X3Q9_TRIBI|nr:3FTx-Tri1 [Trimorphodon biscutatus]
MKTLLLSLMVVGFVYLVSGDNRICYSCTRRPCWGLQHCAEGQNLCYEKKFKDDPFGMKTVKGCTDNCTIPGQNEKVTCCSYDKCN